MERKEPKFSSYLENNESIIWEGEKGAEWTFPSIWRAMETRNEREKKESNLNKNGSMQQEGMKGKRRGMREKV